MTYRARAAGRRGNGRRPPPIVVTPDSFMAVLKEMYPASATPCHSPCILEAFKRNWITREGLRRIPKWDMRPGLYDLAYRKAPLFSMLARGGGQ